MIDRPTTRGPDPPADPGGDLPRTLGPRVLRRQAHPDHDADGRVEEHCG